jgi:ATP-binding cassette, subfamily B, bacterial CvaB/MchF/RaxB
LSFDSPFNIAFGRRLPLILQSEISECGLAALAMIGVYYGHDVDLNGLRQRFAPSLKGTTLHDLMAIANTLDFGCRALRIEMNHVPELQLPCILHWDLNHYVVLKEIRRNHVIIHDPASGVARLTLAEMSMHFSGVVLELTPTAEFRPQTIQIPLRLNQLWSRMTGWRSGLAQTLFLSAVLQLFVLAAPFYLQLVIDEAVPRLDLQFLGLLTFAFGLMYLFQALTEGLRSWTIVVLSQTMTFQMTGNVVRHLLRLPITFFEKRFVGDVMSRMSSTRYIQEALTQSVVAALIDGGLAAITGILMLVYSPILGAIVIASLAMLAVVAFFLYPIRRRRQEEELIARGQEQSHIIESILAIPTVKVFGREFEREARWRNLFAKVINANVAVRRLEIVLESTQTALFGVQLVLVVYCGAKSVIAGTFTVGMMFAFMSYRQNFVERGRALIQRGLEIRLVVLHLNRLSDIVQTPRDEDSTMHAVRADDIRGGIQLENVAFRYASSEPFVVKDVSLSIQPGEFIAIVGASGSGKTTLLKLILGLYDPTDGRILVDGLPRSSLGIRTWRSRIGVVQQDDRLLAGSIADNISFFAPISNMERIRECAALAQIDDDIMQMPMNYLSMIGEMGSAFSGGQRQRILLARALYAKPQILFLDEGTAHLDPATETLVSETIQKMSITRVVIAHRPELVRRADHVYEMRAGKLLELNSGA